jgi:hypothetical protein
VYNSSLITATEKKSVFLRLPNSPIQCEDGEKHFLLKKRRFDVFSLLGGPGAPCLSHGLCGGAWPLSMREVRGFWVCVRGVPYRYS